MSGKIKLAAKWTFVFFVLSVWTFFVVGSVGLGSATDDLFNRKFNLPIFIENGGELNKAGSSDIVNFLFNHDFSSETVRTIVPEEKCSVRAKSSGGFFGGEEVTGNADLSFNVNYLENGRGTLSARFGRDYLTSNFKISEVAISNTETLSLKANGVLNVNRNKVPFDDLMIEFDKNVNSVELSGGDAEIELNGMEAFFVEGCGSTVEEYVVLHDEGELDERRSIDEVRALLRENPALIDAYEGLNSAFTDYWFLALPGAGVLVS